MTVLSLLTWPPYLPDAAGCSILPAFWSYNQSPSGWPLKSEIDVVEGVNLQTMLVLACSVDRNKMTFHTGPGCTLDENPSNGPLSQGFSGTPLSRTCDVQVRGTPLCACYSGSSRVKLWTYSYMFGLYLLRFTLFEFSTTFNDV